MDKLYKKVKLTHVGDGARTTTENVIRETGIVIKVNGQPLGNVIGLLDKQKKEFVVGHLFSRGIINRARDIKAVTIKKGVADVTLNQNITKRTTEKKVKSTLKVTREDIYKCVQAVLGSPVFAETEGVHAAGLFRRGKELVCLAEDIGRHNALDKVIGAGLVQGVDFRQTLVASTGRQPAEMVTKICRAGIPIIATKAAVTDRGIALAEQHGVTLIGFVRESGSKLNTDMSVRTFKDSTMKIYTGASRIICE
jgi:FdhD protein